MTKPMDRASRSRPVKGSDPGVADLARAANGVGEPVDPQEIAQGLMKAQMEAMNTMVSASMSMTAATLKAMTQVWGMGLPGRRRDGDADR